MPSISARWLIVILVCAIARSPATLAVWPPRKCRMLTPASNPWRLTAMKSRAGPWNQVAVIHPSVGCHTVANRSQSPASRHSAQFSTSSRMANLSASAVGSTEGSLVVEAVTYGHTACHRRHGTIERRIGPRPPWHNLAARLPLFDALMSVGHDFGIE